MALRKAQKLDKGLMPQMVGTSVCSWGPGSGSEQGQRARAQSVANTRRGLRPGEGWQMSDQTWKL